MISLGKIHPSKVKASIPPDGRVQGVFGSPLMLELTHSNKVLRAPFIGKADGVLAMVLTRAERELKTVVISGANRTNVGIRMNVRARKAALGTESLATPADGTLGITSECISGRIEGLESAIQAALREATEEAGTQGDAAAFVVGPPTFPDPGTSIEAHHHVVSPRRNLCPENLRPAEGDESGGEFGQHPSLVNFTGLQWLNQWGHHPLDHNLLTFLRLRAALGTADPFQWNGEPLIPKMLAYPNRFPQLPRQIIFGERLATLRLTGTDHELNVETYKAAVIDQSDTRTEIPFPAMISYLTGDIDRTTFLLTYLEGKKRYIIIPEATLQPIHFARQLERARLTAGFNPETFATGIEFPVPLSLAYAENLKRAGCLASPAQLPSLESIARFQQLERIVGPRAAVNARIAEAHGFSMPTHGVLATGLHPFVVEIPNPNEIDIAAGFQAVEIEQAFELIGRQKLIARTLEVMMLQLSFAEGREVPGYFRFDNQAFQEAL